MNKFSECVDKIWYFNAFSIMDINYLKIVQQDTHEKMIANILYLNTDNVYVYIGISITTEYIDYQILHCHRRWIMIISYITVPSIIADKLLNNLQKEQFEE